MFHKQQLKVMPETMRGMMAAALMAGLLAVNVAPALGADAATADDTAKFLAGMPPAADSPLAALTKDPAWQQHARYFDSIFAREESRTLSKVREFSKEHLADKHDTMLYMFSGPDFLYATSFFPSASTYVLAGLEPAGDIPPLTSLSRSVVDGTLHNLEASTGSLLSYSFFITQKMQTQLHGGPVYGTLPVLLVFMARTGKTVHDISFVNLDTDGNILNPNEPATVGVNKKKAVNSAAPGVKIVFSADGGPKQTLYYFSTNLADGSVERSGFLTFCDRLGAADSFIKSASYLLHSGSFSKIRSFLLEHSATLLEDDSGIPLAYFDPKKWHLRPFGHYVGPLSIFRGAYQSKMSELFRKSAPIGFGIGYRWRQSESNLLLAQKGAPATSEELTSPSPSDRYREGADSQAPKKSSKPHRKRVENDVTGSLGCRFGGIFPFCSNPPPKASR